MAPKPPLWITFRGHSRSRAFWDHWKADEGLCITV